MEGLKWSHFYRRSIQDCSFQSHHLLTFKYSSYLTHMVHIKSVLTAFLLKGVSTVKAQNKFHSICGLNSNGPNNPVSVIASGCPTLKKDFKQKFSDCHDDSGKCSAQFQKLLPELLDKVFYFHSDANTNRRVFTHVKGMLTVYETPTHYVEDREYIQLVSHFLEKNLEKQYQDAIQKPPNLDLTNGIHGFNKIKHRSLLTAYAALIVDCCTLPRP